MIDRGVVDVVFENALVTDWAEWAWVSSHLPDRFRSVLSNRRGRIASRRCAGGVERHPEDALFERPFIAVGHSVGGLFACEIAARHLRLCLGVILVDSSKADQFAESSQAFFQVLWLRQLLFRRVISASLGRGGGKTPDWMRGTETLPEWAQDRVGRSLSDPTLWLGGCNDLSYLIRGGGRIGAAALGGVVRRVVADQTLNESPEHVAFEVDAAGSEVLEGVDHMSIVMSEAPARRIADIVQEVAESGQCNG